VILRQYDLTPDADSQSPQGLKFIAAESFFDAYHDGYFRRLQVDIINLLTPLPDRVELFSDGMIVSRDYVEHDESLEVRLYHRKQARSFHVAVRTVSDRVVTRGSKAWEVMNSLSELIMTQTRNGDPLDHQRPYSAAGQMAKAILQNSPHVYKIQLTEYGVDPRHPDRTCKVTEALKRLREGGDPAYGWMYYGGSGNFSSGNFIDEDSATGIFYH
jgi:hypothetical protein